MQRSRDVVGISQHNALTSSYNTPRQATTRAVVGRLWCVVRAGQYVMLGNSNYSYVATATHKAVDTRWPAIYRN